MPSLEIAGILLIMKELWHQPKIGPKAIAGFFLRAFATYTAAD
jgi:hypothetical protein